MMYAVVLRYEMEDGRYSRLHKVEIAGASTEARNLAFNWVGKDWIKSNLQNQSSYFIDEYTSARTNYQGDDIVYRVATIMSLDD